MAGNPHVDEINGVLDTLHQAATDAEIETYFGLFADDAVFIGTDATERWDMAAFRGFAEPHFGSAPAWSYTPATREVHLDDRGRTAWFYETLTHARYGHVRGSGVLRRDRSGWAITQYVLSFPVPNDKARAALSLIAGASTLPTPYTAAQIRDAYQPGFVSTYRHVRGADVSLQRTTVVSATAAGVSLRFEPVDAAGNVVGDVTTGEATWEELRDHAAFPAHATEHFPDETVVVPYGTVHVRRYVVAGPDGTTRTFWFAPSMPGPPVRMTITNSEGPVSAMELVQRSGG